jgi:hypothetical protein
MGSQWLHYPPPPPPILPMLRSEMAVAAEPCSLYLFRFFIHFFISRMFLTSQGLAHPAGPTWGKAGGGGLSIIHMYPPRQAMRQPASGLDLSANARVREAGRGAFNIVIKATRQLIRLVR